MILKKKTKSTKGQTDGISNLEELHETMKREREAWEKLIENLKVLQTKTKKD